MNIPSQDIPLPADFICRKFNISRTTLWRWRRAGLPAQGVGAKIFIRESAVAAFIQRMGDAENAITKGENKP